MARKIAVKRIRRRKRRPFDPFEIVGRIPKDKSYQWIAVSVSGSTAAVARHNQLFKDAGWRPVPPSRHPKMARRGRRIVVGDQILVERKKGKTQAASLEEKQQAERLLPGAAKAAGDRGFFGTVVGLHVGGGLFEGPRFPYELPPVPVRADFAARLAAARTQLQEREGVQFVDITIGFPITDREVETAVHLELDPIEYARRRVIMRRRESDGPIVLMEVIPGVFKFAEIGAQPEK